MSTRKSRVGMIGGGGPANFFGAPHRRTILMDNSAELTAGALRSKPEESIESANELFFTRGYPDWKTMIDSEGALGGRTDRLRDDRHSQRRPLRPRGRRGGVGIGVLCEKPLTTTLEEAKELQKVVAKHKTPFIVAYTYTGFPMVMFARTRPRRQDRPGAQGRGVVSPRLARLENRGKRPKTSSLEGRSQKIGGVGMRRRYRHTRV